MGDREKKAEPGKDENKAESGLGKEQGQGKRETLGRKKGGTDSSGKDRALCSGNIEFQTCSCTLHSSLSFRHLRWLLLVLLK